MTSEAIGPDMPRPAGRPRPRGGVAPGGPRYHWSDLFRPAADPADGPAGAAAVWLVLIAVLFNPALALINGHVIPLGEGTAIASEILIFAFAHLVILQHFRRDMKIWYLFIIGAMLFAVMRTAVTGTFEPKFVRDMMVMPTFVMLGVLAGPRRVLQMAVLICLVTTACLALEGFDPQGYGEFFQIKSFYINMRGINPAKFTNPDSLLYISADRPEARYFPFFDLHRMSGIFLEPVSLGNMMVLIVAVTVAFWPSLSTPLRIFFVANIVLFQFACDGRLSFAAALLIVLSGVVRPLLPRGLAVTALPFAILAAIGLTLFADLKSTADTLSGRIAYSAYLTLELRIADLVGASSRLVVAAEDSGFVYLIVTQSVLGLIFYWAMFVYGLPERTPLQHRFKNAAAIYLGISMIVAFSFTSIKTAAFLWAAYGALIAHAAQSARRLEAREAAEDRPAGAAP